MIDWVDAMGRSWGYQLRRHLTGDGDMPSLAGRVMELGPVGASIKGSGAQRFAEGLLGDALEFHIAWKRMDRHDYRQTLAMHYVEPGPVKRKAHFLNIAQSTYWQRLDYAQRAIASVIEYGECPYGHSAAVGGN